jgi:beta-carotene hydroxylase
MRPRYAADYKTLLWLALATANALVVWFVPASRSWLVPLGCYFALCCGLIAHNHNHCPTFKNRTANEVLNHVATIFYGFAAFNWVPTHNNNHHKFTNAPGDATITWRYTNKHNALIAFTYPFISAIAQVPVIDAYVKEQKEKRPALYRSIMGQLFLCWGLPVVLTFIDWRATVAAIWIPRGFSLYTIIYFNYIQHVHCDPYSKWNHSRSFTGKIANWLLFNNGYHAVHHLKAGMHWSLAPAAHAEVAHHIHPELNPRSLFWWMFKSYVLGLFVPRFATHQIGRAPNDPPADVTEVEAVAAE